MVNEKELSTDKKGNVKKGKYHSTIVAYNKGKWRFGINVISSSSRSFTFKPFVEVIDGFDKVQKVKFKINIQLNDKAKDKDPSVVVRGDEWRTYSCSTKIKAKGTYYPDVVGSSGKGTSAEKSTYKKVKGKRVSSKNSDLKKTKKKQGLTRSVKKGDYWTNYDNDLKIKVTVGKSSLTWTFTFTKKGPAAPVYETNRKKYSYDPANPNRRRVVPTKVSDSKFIVGAYAVGTFKNPIKKICLGYKDSTAKNDWTIIEGKADAGGGTYTVPGNNGDTNSTGWHLFTDPERDSSTKRWYALISYDDQGDSTDKEITMPGESKGEKEKVTYANIPAVEGLTHQRLNDKENVLLVTRSPKYITDGVYRDFQLEVSNDNGINWAIVPHDNKLKTNLATYKNASGKMVPADWIDPEQNADKITIAKVSHATELDKSYRYRIFPISLDTDGQLRATDVPTPSADGTEITYNTPAPPKSVNAVMREDGYVTVTITKSANSTANLYYVERSEDEGKTWDYADENNGESGIEIKDMTKTGTTLTYTDKTLITSASVMYRVSFANNINFELPTIGNGLSGYTTSPILELLQKPNPPVPSMPFNGATVTTDQTSVVIGWIHSPNDGTAQTQACLQYRVRGNSDWTTLISETAGYTAAYYEVTDQNTRWKVNDVIEWRVRTKGAHKDFSDWSDIQTFKVYAKPSIVMTSPTSKTKIQQLPIILSWSYEDPSGSLASLILDIVQSNDIVETYDMTSVSSGAEFADYIFDNDSEYVLRLTATSTTNLSDSTSVSISVEYERCLFKHMVSAGINFDSETGYGECVITADDEMTEEDVATLNADLSEEDLNADPYQLIDTSVKTLYVYRVYGDDRTLIGRIPSGKATDTLDVYDTDGNYQLSDVTILEDRYVPINADFNYELLMVGQNGSICVQSVTVYCPSIWWYCYYGDNGIAKTRWEPTGSVQLSRPEKQQVRYSGRSYPVSYDSNARNETASFSCKVYDEDVFRGTDYDDEDAWGTINAFREMMETGGRGVWKSFEGDVYPADFEFSYSSDYTDKIRSWTLSLNVTRIDEGFDYDLESDLT